MDKKLSELTRIVAATGDQDAAINLYSYKERLGLVEKSFLFHDFRYSLDPEFVYQCKIKILGFSLLASYVKSYIEIAGFNEVKFMINDCMILDEMYSDVTSTYTRDSAFATDRDGWFRARNSVLGSRQNKKLDEFCRKVIKCIPKDYFLEAARADQHYAYRDIVEYYEEIKHLKETIKTQKASLVGVIVYGEEEANLEEAIEDNEFILFEKKSALSKSKSKLAEAMQWELKHNNS